ncbi:MULTISPECIES: VOC family protein [Streptomyces]|uniref:Glyoxalase n=1 Tax=Streptomyces alboflavus TaxID=67267 RepID=A0A1Z1W970_9ACTN|nr:VOC family protein [Streptomyces alboflavus]ARX83013.1 glyoxalase [Streptomyces alboflavus]
MNSNENPQNAQKAQNAQTSQTTVNRRPADVWATFQAQDAPALIDFLVGTVGFLRTAVYEDGGRVAHAQLDWPEGGGVMLGSHDPKAAEWCLQPGTFGAYVVTDHVDDLYLRLTTAGVKVIREIEDQPYGSREFAIADPEGNKWSFGTYRGEPRPDQG